MRLRRWPTASVILLVFLAVLAGLRLVGSRPSGTADVILHEGHHVVARVIDGDTLLLASGHRVRLIGVDTPETKHPDKPIEALGREASQLTATLIGNDGVRLEFDRERRDVYHRLLAYVFLVDGRLLNEELIRAGFSEAQTRFPYRTDMQRRFLTAQAEAQAAERGLWAAATPRGDDRSARHPSPTLSH